MTVNDPRCEVPNEQIQKLLQDIARALISQMPEGWCFSLMIFSYGEQGSLFYISSAQRDDMIKTMREFIQKQGML